MTRSSFATHEVINQSPPFEVARLAVERLALLAACAALQTVSPRSVELFAATRLAADHGSLYGAVEFAAADIRGLLERALA